MSRAALLAVSLLSLSAVAAAPARADVLSTFNFSGICGDCAGTGTGQLVLSNYTLGQQIDDTNFVSLTYNGTNLFGPYTVTAADLPALSGSINSPLPGTETVIISTASNPAATSSVDFESLGTGYWCTGQGFSCSDMGATHQWSLATAAVTAVPEPMTASLLGGGLLGLAALRRRK